MSDPKKLDAIEKREQNPQALKPFSLSQLKRRLPLTFPLDSNLPPSPKRRYRSHYRYLGFKDLNSQALKDLSSFETSLRLFDYSNLESLLAAHIYRSSAKGQAPFHPVSLYLLILFRRENHLSRLEALRRLRNKHEGQELRRLLGFEKAFPSESGLRYFEKQITPELQREINALQIDVLYEAGLLPAKPDAAKKVTISFDGMLHEARSHMRCAHTQAHCYQPAPRPCPAREKGKQGCDCATDACLHACQYTTSRDPDARFIAYSGRNKRNRKSPNAPAQDGQQRLSRGRLVFGYYSGAAQILDDDLATYWVLPAAFGPATCGDQTLFPENFTYLRSRFSWLEIDAVLADAGLGEQSCLDLIWDAGALRMVDIQAHATDADKENCLARGYNPHGYPFCPFGYCMKSNGHDYQRRRTKWRCAKNCRSDPDRPVPDCDYLKPQYKHGYTIYVGRTHADGTVRLAREIPYASPAWYEIYNRRNSAESRNSLLERLGLKRLPVHGLQPGHVAVMQGDLISNQHTLIRLIRQAAALGLDPPSA
jgi:hypothetical protein